ncbi:hypothetical protein A3C98_00425 [Candidatus Roizmanbacteria bacterium RIFCSPHIGHO2_02_FULL_37_15]|uniref:Uncharacterized protein n=1 Tax=Candidatus Roizmanbacteria bacterium RIFCSPLOWO2_01_FULL_37_16 TaxID=1802058 RepID=A0A1F7IQR5_9BACT|nr:MAG: hypothetical protein A2859_02600 [Candidatus Roizmanbacteria bacterium RIFCSPHIGHO2_01_FULL_37_16b]OGK22199.1 MAG: hypothetical protein A3C98_00425 [Candidatus Roizmanbacteria bacterium RIFCSPHIGHO2_02_FULL_37_15]OGK45716.1 MAG: hypothetical protein A3B40_05560 [Candidatus Roizmanbacteria bacterium RIFCSPLOWO2_01_FULL_37_16]OGK57810.1 MAG: hypothetical protein A3I50_04155 [Candidatus Roizmanbacteria bacterium RIFCSPLOWO2_02_FULL_37_9]
MIRQIFKQSGIFFFGSVVSKVVTTFAWILLARVLVPEKYGQFTLYFMILQFVTFIADFGLNQYYMKNVENFGRTNMFNRILFVRSMTLLFSGGLMLLILFSFKIFSSIITTIFILSMVPMSYLSVTDGYYLERKKTFRASLKLASIGTFFLLGYLFFNRNIDLFTVVTLLLFSLIITLIWYFPWKELKFIKISFSESFSILKTSSSYAYLTLTSFFYNKGDSFIISYLKGNTALGIYGLAYRFLESLSLFPSALVQNLFPVSAKKAGITFSQLKKITLIMFLFGLLFALGVFVFSPFLITSFFRQEYFGAVYILRIFSLVIFLFFLNSPLATVVQSSNLVKSFLPFGIINTLVNLVLNLFLVRSFGIIAAAWVMVITETTGLFINIYFVKKLYSRSYYNPK